MDSEEKEVKKFYKDIGSIVKYSLPIIPISIGAKFALENDISQTNQYVELLTDSLTDSFLSVALGITLATTTWVSSIYLESTTNIGPIKKDVVAVGLFSAYASLLSPDSIGGVIYDNIKKEQKLDTPKTTMIKLIDNKDLIEATPINDTKTITLNHFPAL